MHRLTFLPLIVALAACGTEPNTSITSDGTSSSSVGDPTGGVVTTGDPAPLTGTGGTGDLTGSTSGQGGTDSVGTSGDDTTGEQTSTATTFGTDTATTTTGEPNTTGVPQTTGETGDTDGFVDCATLKADYQAELAEIGSCVDDSECGQELKGTSCGCTHNAVARLDADSSELYALLMLADEHRCELILAGTCDCPAAEGFVCTDGQCGWNYL
jgi:hypothetical protein